MNPGHNVKYTMPSEKSHDTQGEIYDSICIKYPEKVNSETEEGGRKKGNGHILFRGWCFLLG